MTSLLPILSYPTVESGSAGDPSLDIAAVQQSSEDLRIALKKADVEPMSERLPKDLKKTVKKKRRPSRKGEEKNELTAKERSASKAKSLSRALQEVKKAVLEVQLFLLDGVNEKTQLRAATPLLTQAEYSDVVLERSYINQCGYPLCKNWLPAEKTRKGRFRISLREHKVYDLSETFLFCCTDCLIASKTFQSELQAQRTDIVGRDELLSILRFVCHANTLKGDPVKKSSGEHIHAIEGKTQPDELTISSVHERNENAVARFEDAGPFDAIEGYVPQNQGRHLPHQNRTGKSKFSKERKTKQGGDSESGGLKSGDESVVSSVEPQTLDKGGVQPLKSCLKKSTTPPKPKRSVSWADLKKRERKEEAKAQQQASGTGKSCPKKVEGSVITATSPACANAEDRVVDTGSPAGSDELSSENIDAPQNHEGHMDGKRVLAAEEIALALVEAADAAAAGEVGSAEAVVRAGLCILPGAADVTIDAAVSTVGRVNTTESSEPHGTVPAEVAAPRATTDDQVDGSVMNPTTAKGAWFDKPPPEFKVEVSVFGLIWMALEEWTSAATVAYLYGREPQDQEDFVVSNGREYSRHKHVADSTSTAIANMVSTCLSNALPQVVEDLRLNVPVSVLGQHLGRLVKTMIFIEALPAFSSVQWNLILTLLVVGLSAQQLPRIGTHLDANVPLLLKFLDSVSVSEAEYNTFRDLLLPLGRVAHD